jgi:hypothetical protein
LVSEEIILGQIMVINRSRSKAQTTESNVDIMKICNSVEIQGKRADEMDKGIRKLFSQNDVLSATLAMEHSETPS